MKSQLFRSSENKVFGGVAGGLGEYFDIDPVIIRVLFFVTALAWGISFLIYIGLWIFVPLKENDEPFIRSAEDDLNSAFEELGVKPKNDNSQRKVVAGAILIIIGLFVLLENLVSWVSYKYLVPILLVILGGYIIYVNIEKNK